MGIEFRRRDSLRFTEAERRIGQAIRQGFEPLGDKLAEWIKDRGPSDRDRFKKSVSRRVSGRALQTRLTVSASARHAEYIEEGREPGKAPPPQVLLAWVRRKGLGAAAFSVKTRRQVSAGTRRSRSRKTGKLRTRSQSLAEIQKGIAFVIGRKIAKEGLPRNTGLPPSHRLRLFKRVRKENASQIGQALRTIRAKVATLLNTGK